jgi:hypothetical protein
MTSLFGLQILREYRYKRHLEEERFPQRLQQKGSRKQLCIPQYRNLLYQHSLQGKDTHFPPSSRPPRTVSSDHTTTHNVEGNVFGWPSKVQRAHILSVDIAAYYTSPSLRIRKRPNVNNNYALVTGLLTGTILGSVEKILVTCSKIYKAWSSVNRPSRKK